MSTLHCLQSVNNFRAASSVIFFLFLSQLGRECGNAAAVPLAAIILQPIYFCCLKISPNFVQFSPGHSLVNPDIIENLIVKYVRIRLLAMQSL
jgi:hypothetical protein